jgi:1-acyl-sn-glycerol-3-phosphate acyltransferase
MIDLPYKIVYGLGWSICWITSRPLVLHADRATRDGAYILASSHLTPYDVPALMKNTPRDLDFISTVELLNTPIVGRIFTAMHCVFVDRSRPDATAALAVTNKLRAGRVVAMFPEGNIREEEKSVINGGNFKPGVIRLAQLGQAPIIPAVVLGTKAYYAFKAWLPFRSIRYGVIYGNPIVLDPTADPEAAKAKATAELHHAFIDLAAELTTALSTPSPK